MQLPVNPRLKSLARLALVAALAPLATAALDFVWRDQPRAAAAEPAARELARIISGEHRSAANRARDRYRHPADVMGFLAIAPDARVIEIGPGVAGYWTEILAPYLKDKGRYVAAGPSPASSSKAGVSKLIERYAAKLAADPMRYGKVEVIEFAPGVSELGPPASADVVLTFRNLHNWMATGKVQAVLAAFHRVLKPGGVLGIVEHRGRTDLPQDPKAKSGYVRQDYAIGLVEAAGFKLVASSEANANPKDSKDHPAGVWTLPPTFRLRDQDRDKYAAIGESDRFTLKFVKR